VETEIQPPQLDELTAEDAYEVFNAAAHRYLGMSGEEFTRAWDAGEFDERAELPEVVRVAMLLSFGR
jgi:hypothetical protein